MAREESEGKGEGRDGEGDEGGSEEFMDTEK